MTHITGIIPARYKSTRFPGKPLAQILGKPLIQIVYENAKKSKFINELIIATDDERIYDVAKKFNADVVMTPSEIPTGTDRVAFVAKEINTDIVVNIQGDEPLLTADMIDSAIAPFFTEEKIDISTLAVKIKSEDDLFNPNVVKVVFDKNNFALYFSRSPIPFCRDATTKEEWLKRGEYYKHIGIYVYSKASLLKFVNLPHSKLEEFEKLEQLRALENGMKIKVVVTEKDTIGVDTPNDLEKVIQIFKNKKEFSNAG